MDGTARSVSSNRYKDDSVNRAREIAKKNGYKRYSLSDRINATNYSKGASCPRVPFTSESFRSQVQKIFLEHGFQVKVIAKSSPTLNKLFVKFRCMTAHAKNSDALPAQAAQMTMQHQRSSRSECVNTYAGETGVH